MFSWNIGADIPDGLSIRKAYPLLISILDREVEEVTEGHITIEFCTYDPPTCPFPEHCNCKEYYEKSDEIIRNTPMGDGELPF